MAIQLGWEEQLISELLSLKGYFVETNIGIPISMKGGLREADVVAVRVRDNEIIIRHIEIGTLSSKFEYIIDSVIDKFRPDSIQFIKNYVLERLSISQEPKWDYSCEYVYTYVADKNEGPMREELGKKDISFTSFDDMIVEDIPRAFEEWKKGRIGSKAVGDKDWTKIQLPRKYRMLCLLDLVFWKTNEIK